MMTHSMSFQKGDDMKPLVLMRDRMVMPCPVCKSKDTFSVRDMNMVYYRCRCGATWQKNFRRPGAKVLNIKITPIDSIWEN